MRKITGNCYNQLRVLDDGSVNSYPANPIGHSMVFRIMSSWYNTREDMLRLLNGTMSGPSNLAGTDLNTNKHLWIQGGVRVTQTIRNSKSYPVYVQIYKCNLKCDDAGQSGGVYVEGTLPFASPGSANSSDNVPGSAYWDFFDQSSRMTMGSAGDTAYMKFTADNALAGNSVGGYASSLAVAGNYWEVASGNSDGLDFRERMPLTWIFPEIRRKLKVRTIFSGWIPSEGSRTYSYVASMPHELRPRDYLSNDCMNFSKHSYFLMVRAFAAPMLSSVPTQGYQVSVTDALRNTLAVDRAPYGFWRPPVCLSFTESRTYRLRRQGDSIPSFGCIETSDAVPVGGSPAGGGWLGGAWGLVQYVTYSGTPSKWCTTTLDNTDGTETWLPAVPSHRQRVLVDNGAAGVPYLSSGAFSSFGAK